MRQLKFRVFDFFKKCWVKSWVDHCSQSIAFLPEESDTDEHTVEFFDAFNGSEFIFQQFTGLKDKNDKEIYEGDILKYETGLGPIYWRVYWNSEDGQWKINKEQGGNVGSWFDQYTVAGNIFETPELLEKL
jgi:uncharacterized phage protein (TIGR01671 family)